MTDLRTAKSHGVEFPEPTYSAWPSSNREWTATKLRLRYENAPLAFLGERAGGAASDGTQAILDIVPEELHQRTPLFIGSKADVEEAVQRLRG